MSYANCHLVELSIEVVPCKFNIAHSKDHGDCGFTDVTHKPRFQVIKRAKFCSHCDKHEHYVL